MAFPELAAPPPFKEAARARQITASAQRRVLRLSVWAALALMLLSRVSASVVDIDIWHEMALFRAALAAGRMPQTDLFAYTATLPHVVHHEWGAGAIALAVAAFPGGAGLLALKYLIAALIGWLCYRTSESRAERVFPAFSMLAPLGILLVGAAFSPVRAHLYSLLFLTVLLWFLERDRRGSRRWIPFWLALSIVWINVHGGFALAIAILGVCGLERWWRGEPWLHLPATAAAMMALVPVNPYGAGYYEYLWRALRMPRTEIPEWYPVWQAIGSMHGIGFLLSVACVVWVIGRLGIRGVPGVSVLCVLAVAGATHQRLLPFYAVAWTAYLPGCLMALPAGAGLCRLFERPNRWLQLSWWMAAVFFLEMTVACRPWRLEVPAEGPADAVVYPVGAVDYLACANFHGNLMTPFEYGAYVTWRMYPAIRVSIDSRYEVAYPGWWADRIFRLYRAQSGWRQTLSAYPTDAVLVRRTQALSRAMRQEPDWQRVYADASYEIYARPGLKLPAAGDAGRPRPGRFP